MRGTEGIEGIAKLAGVRRRGCILQSVTYPPWLSRHGFEGFDLGFYILVTYAEMVTLGWILVPNDLVQYVDFLDHTATEVDIL